MVETGPRPCVSAVALAPIVPGGAGCARRPSEAAVGREARDVAAAWLAVAAAWWYWAPQRRDSWRLGLTTTVCWPCVALSSVRRVD